MAVLCVGQSFNFKTNESVDNRFWMWILVYGKNQDRFWDRIDCWSYNGAQELLFKIMIVAKKRYFCWFWVWAYLWECEIQTNHWCSWILEHQRPTLINSIGNAAPITSIVPHYWPLTPVMRLVIRQVFPYHDVTMLHYGPRREPPGIDLASTDRSSFRHAGRPGGPRHECDDRHRFCQTFAHSLPNKLCCVFWTVALFESHTSPV